MAFHAASLRTAEGLASLCQACYDARLNVTDAEEHDMGKGDRKTRRGKINRASYGNSRLHAAQPAVAGAKPVVTKPAAVKKAAPRKKSA